MDFASLMSAQISKSSSPTNPEDSSSYPNGAAARYQKRADLQAGRDRVYREEQAARETERLQRTDKKRRQDEEEAQKHREREAKRLRLADEVKQKKIEEDEKCERERRKRLGLPEAPPLPGAVILGQENGDQNTIADLEDEQLYTRLRGLDQPAKMFGETHKERLERYRDVLPRNTRQGAVADPSQPVSTSLAPVSEDDTTVSAKIPPTDDQGGRLLLSRRLTTWFNVIFREWGVALARRDENTKRSFSGMSATNSHAQVLQHLRPLFRKLEQLPSNPEVLPNDLLQPLVQIVFAAQQRRYVDANDGYLKLSIGKAAWPIGVTMVGIHERSAREKLHGGDGEKAHIMSDESTRKILQSIKRCLSFAQVKWPPENLGQLMG